MRRSKVCREGLSLEKGKGSKVEKEVHRGTSLNVEGGSIPRAIGGMDTEVSLCSTRRMWLSMLRVERVKRVADKCINI